MLIIHFTITHTHTHLNACPSFQVSTADLHHHLKNTLYSNDLSWAGFYEEVSHQKNQTVISVSYCSISRSQSGVRMIMLQFCRDLLKQYCSSCIIFFMDDAMFSMSNDKHDHLFMPSISNAVIALIYMCLCLDYYSV